MKLAVAVPIFVLLAASPALAVDGCPIAPSTTYTPDDTGITVLFDSMIASNGPSTDCNLVTPNKEVPEVPPAGTISAYAADYRGFVAQGDRATLTVTESGVTRTVVINPTDDDFEDKMLHSYVGTDANGDIRSDISLGLVSPDDASVATVESVDYLLLATTTVGDQSDSLDQVSAAQTAVITHLNTTAGLVLGVDKPLERDNEIGLLGAVGSHTVGATGHYNFGDGFSVDGGVTVFDQSAGGASASGVLLGGKATYVTPDDGSGFRWLGSAGVTAAPNMTMRFSRDYLNTANDTMVSGDGSGNGNLIGIWVEGGVLVAPAPDNEIVFSASLARNWLNFDYAEEQTDTNPFALSIDDATSTYDTVKAKAAWTAQITPDVDLTVHGAVGYINANDDVTADVALVGPLTVGGQSEAFIEYGARVGWSFADQARWDVFALGSTGAESGTHVQVGTAVSMKF